MDRWEGGIQRSRQDRGWIERKRNTRVYVKIMVGQELGVMKSNEQNSESHSQCSHLFLTLLSHKRIIVQARAMHNKT